MDVVETKICRLCLKVCDSNFEMLEGTKRMLNVLLIKINLSTTEEAFTCKTCTESIKTLFDFKSVCLHTQDCINDFLREGNTDKLNLKEVYLSKNKKAVNISNDNLVCQLCMELVGSGSFLFLNSEEKYSVWTKVMIQKSLPELHLGIIEESVVCITCCEFLESYSSFTETCLNVEAKIQSFYEAGGTCSKGQAKLSQVLDFSLKGSFVNKDSLEEIKKEEKCFDIQKDVVEIKEEETDIHIRFEEVVVETGNSYIERFEDSKDIPKISVNETMNNCEMYAYPNAQEEQLEDHVQPHADSLENCNLFADESVPEETVYKCEICGHHAKNKQHLKSHMLVHKNASEVTMYRCTECAYQTKYKSCLPRHVLSHKKISEVTTYKCHVCSYQARRNDTLRKHMRTHNQLLEFSLDANVLDAAPFQCDTCAYQTNSKRCLVAHVVRHRSNLERENYKCKICDYHTKHRQDLKSHMLVHKSKSEVAMFKCTECPYQTKYNSCLHRHLLCHRKISEVTAYQCDMCSYRTRRSDSLRKHMRTHNRRLEVSLDEKVSGIVPYKCDT